MGSVRGNETNLSLIRKKGESRDLSTRHGMYCKKCGKALPSDGFLCKFCGAMMDSSQIKKQKEYINNKDKKEIDINLISDKYSKTKEYKRHKENKIFGVIFVLVILVILIVVAVLKVM